LELDIVIWDSHPLNLGATPTQRAPKVPNFDKEAEQAVKYEGLQPIGSNKLLRSVAFVNVNSVYRRFANGTDGQSIIAQHFANGTGAVVVVDGHIICVDKIDRCIEGFFSTNHNGVDLIDLNGGSISPALTSFGSALGLEEIGLEDSTNDGVVIDQLTGFVPQLMAAEGSIIRALDGLRFATRNAL
jgi:hypothetical protein